MSKRMVRVSSMFEMSDDDAEVIMSRVVDAVHTHDTIPDFVKSLIAIYGEEPILTGMTIQKAIDRNDSISQCDEAADGFTGTTFQFAEALGMNMDEAIKICKDVGELAEKSQKWKTVFASVGWMFGERAVYAGAFLLYLYTKAEGEPAKKYDFGHG